MDLKSQLANKPISATSEKVVKPGKSSIKKKNSFNMNSILNLIMVFLILFLLLYLAWVVYKTLTYKPTQQTQEIKIMEDQAVIDRINGTEPLDARVGSPSGRTDPFSNY